MLDFSQFKLCSTKLLFLASPNLRIHQAIQTSSPPTNNVVQNCIKGKCTLRVEDYINFLWTICDFLDQYEIQMALSNLINDMNTKSRKGLDAYHFMLIL